MSQKLYVGGIAFTTTSEGLRAHFTQSGTVVSAAVVTDQFSGQSRGFGFVEMSTADEAQQAVTQLNERPLDGRSLKVEVAKPKTDKPRSSGGGFGGRSSGGGGGVEPLRRSRIEGGLDGPLRALRRRGRPRDSPR